MTVIRPTEQMHWYLWEAIVQQANAMVAIELLPEALKTEIRYISKQTRFTGKFSEDLRERACKVEAQVDALYEEHFVDLMDCIHDIEELEDKS